MSRAERDAGRRQRLLDAGLQLFATTGYMGTTVQGLCREAGVSSRSFYDYFSSRQELLEALYVLTAEDIETRLKGLQIVSGDTVEDVILRGVQAGVGPMLEDERLGRVVEIESVGVSPALEARRREMNARIAGAIDAMLLDLMRRGLIREFPIGLVGLMIVGGMTEALIVHLSKPESERPPSLDFVTDIAQVIVRIAVA